MSGSLLATPYTNALLFLLGGIFAAQLFLFLMRRYVKVLALQTASDLDDVLVERAVIPSYLAIILLSLYFALLRIPALLQHKLALNKAFFSLLLLLFAYMTSSILGSFITRSLNKHEKSPALIRRVVIVFVYVVAGLMILDYLGVRITPLVTTLGIGGLAIGLALQPTLSNFFAGLYLITSKPFKVGDFIELEGGVTGYVQDVGWRATTIRTLRDELIVYPNEKLTTTVIKNTSSPANEILAPVSCGVSYGSDLELVERVTLGVARRIQRGADGAVRGYEPVMRYRSFGDSNINFLVFLKVESYGHQFRVQHAFIKALKKAYDEEGIEISWPSRKVYDGAKLDASLERRRKTGLPAKQQRRGSGERAAGGASGAAAKKEVKRRGGKGRGERERKRKEGTEKRTARRKREKRKEGEKKKKVC